MICLMEAANDGGKTAVLAFEESMMSSFTCAAVRAVLDTSAKAARLVVCLITPIWEAVDKAEVDLLRECITLPITA